MHKAKLETEIGVERQLRLGEEPREGGFTEVNKGIKEENQFFPSSLP
jgi:hypothetical protein